MKLSRLFRRRFGRAPADAEVAAHMELSAAEAFEKLLVEANAISLVSLNKKWCETDSSKDVREIDILEDKKGEDPTRRIQKGDLMRLVTKGLNRNERLDYHSLLLRRANNERNRSYARPFRKSCEPDAFCYC